MQRLQRVADGHIFGFDQKVLYRFFPPRRTGLSPHGSSSGIPPLSCFSDRGRGRASESLNHHQGAPSPCQPIINYGDDIGDSAGSYPSIKPLGFHKPSLGENLTGTKESAVFSNFGVVPNPAK